MVWEKDGHPAWSPFVRRLKAASAAEIGCPPLLGSKGNGISGILEITESIKDIIGATNMNLSWRKGKWEKNIL